MSDSSTGRLITIQLNGKTREVPEGLTLAGLLDFLQVKRDRVAIERNREIVSAALWDST
ncbi:MAG: sulfur carrier protein ThiS, partial [Bryobacterales bacterium]|nr:sulfur carrier protein ThiS [Bryobacterales bacterium]